MYRVALSSCGKEMNEALFEQYRQNGITAIEISLPPEEYATLDYAKVKELADASGVQLWSLHLPFYPFETLDISAVIGIVYPLLNGFSLQLRKYDAYI